ncbi:MAG: Sua5/YciO/YrdC/YwlC family protein [Deltaproteobacteria bacterium]|nr:MAG: Sua5/YciO/YrdC/YwlC family protein [Deltaproteobacteria bacterium]
MGTGKFSFSGKKAARVKAKVLRAEDIGAGTPEGEAVKSHLLSGGLVVYPTDTLYGLGGIPDRLDVVERIYRMKVRERGKPLPLLAEAVDVALSLFDGPPEAVKRIARSFWPGKVTVVGPSSRVPPLPGDREKRTLGVRVPAHPVARLLAGFCGGSIVGTSANLSGDSPLLDFQGVLEVFGDEDIILLDGGILPPSRGSTVVSVEEGEIRLLREGDVPFRQIEKIVRE